MNRLHQREPQTSRTTFRVSERRYPKPNRSPRAQASRTAFCVSEPHGNEEPNAGSRCSPNRQSRANHAPMSLFATFRSDRSLGFTVPAHDDVERRSVHSRLNVGNRFGPDAAQRFRTAIWPFLATGDKCVSLRNRASRFPHWGARNSAQPAISSSRFGIRLGGFRPGAHTPFPTTGDEVISRWPAPALLAAQPNSSRFSGMGDQFDSGQRNRANPSGRLVPRKSQIGNHSVSASAGRCARHSY